MADYCQVYGVIHFTSPAGWLPVHRDQLGAQRSVTSMGKRYLYHTTSTESIVPYSGSSEQRASFSVSTPDMELGHWVTGSVGHLGHISRPGHRVIISTLCETRVFPVFEKLPKMQNLQTKCWHDKSHCQVTQVSVVGLKSLDVSPRNELLLLPMIIKNSLAWEYFFTHKSTFGVHYRTGSTGSPGGWIPGSLGRWVTKYDPVTISVLSWAKSLNPDLVQPEALLP